MRTEHYYQYITPYRASVPVEWGTSELSVIDAGIPDAVVIETRLLESAKAHLTHYTLSDTNNKYTILVRLPK